MKVVVSKDAKESNERLITRFNKSVQKSRKIQMIRDSRYHTRPLKKRKIRARAIMRDKYRAEREKNKFY